MQSIAKMSESCLEEKGNTKYNLQRRFAMYHLFPFSEVAICMFQPDSASGFLIIINVLGSILKGKEDVFSKELMELSEQPEFNIMAFEGVIDKIRVYVAEVSCRT